MKAPLLVGLLLITSIVSMTFFIMQTGKSEFSKDNSYIVYADFSDASGIRGKTRVQVNGLDIGRIADIGHHRRKDGSLTARVTLRIGDQYTIYKDARVKKAAESLLGDYRLDLILGNPNTGELQPGGVISEVQSVSDMDAIQSELRDIASNVNKVTQSLATVLSGPSAESSIESIIRGIERSMGAIEKTTNLFAENVSRNERFVDSILRDVEQVTGSVASATGAEGELFQLAQNLASLSEKLDNIAGQVEVSLLGGDSENSEDGALRTGVRDLSQSLDNLRKVTDQLTTTDSTMGALLNDRQLIEGLEETVSSVGELVGDLSRVKTEVELKSVYEIPFSPDGYEGGIDIQSAIKNTLGLRIVPRPDSYYMFEAVADPRGKQTRTFTSTSSIDDDGETVSTTDVTETAFNDLKFSAQFAKRYNWLTLRFGIIENTGGLGLNFHTLDDQLEFQLDAFDFDRRDPNNNFLSPRIRLSTLFEFYNHLWIQGGWDDPLNTELQTWYLGGMLRFNDEDLKTIMSIAPSPF